MSKYSKIKSLKYLPPKKCPTYRRDDIVEDLQHPADYRGISHYITEDEKTIYSFFKKGNHNNTWKRPVFNYEVEDTQPEDIKSEEQTRHVFYHGDSCEESRYEYLGTTISETANNGTITWVIP